MSYYPFFQLFPDRLGGVSSQHHEGQWHFGQISHQGAHKGKHAQNKNISINLSNDSLGHGRLLSRIGDTLCHACGQSQKGWPCNNGYLLPEHQLGCAGKRRHTSVRLHNLLVL